MIPRLTPAELLVGFPRMACTRGRSYANKGLVDGLVLVGGRLEAEVRGTRPTPYTVGVELQSDGRRLASDCSCPVGHGGWCKHVVAVLITWGDDLGTVQVIDGDEAEQAPQVDLAHEDTLHAWAEAQGVAAWLGRSALLLDGSAVRSLRWALKTSTIEDVVLGRTPLGPRGILLIDPAVRMLQHRAALVADQLSQERDHRLARETGPADPALVPLWERLAAARVEWRTQAAPDGVRPGQVSLQADEETEALIYREHRAPDCSRAGRAVVSMALAPDRAVLPRCDCPRPPAACAQRLRALDAALERVAGREGTERQHAALRALVTEPRWQRDLDALQEVLAVPEAADDEGRRLAWTLGGHAEAPPWSLQGCLTRPYQRRAGLRRWRLDATGEALEALCAEPGDWRTVALGGGLPFLDGGRGLLGLQALVGHPRVLLPDGERPVAVRAAKLQVLWQDDGDAGVETRVLLDEQPLSSEGLERLLRARQGALSALMSDDFATIDLVEAEPRVWRLLETLALRGRHFPAAAVPKLLDQRAALSRLVSLTLDPSLRGRQVPGSDRVQLRAELLPGPSLHLRARLAPLAGAGFVVPGQGGPVVYGQLDGERVHVVRDLAHEAQQVAGVLSELGLDPDAAWACTLEDPERALDCVLGLQSLEGVDVLWARTPPPLATLDEESDIALRVEKRRGWFALGGDAAADGVLVPLADVLEAVLDGRRFVQAQGAAWVHLSREFRDRLAGLARATRPQGGGLAVAQAAAPAIDALLEGAATLQAPASFQLSLERLRQAQALRPEVPAALQASLREYQRHGFGWLARIAHWSPGACLADDMGLGKTLQALALLLHRREEGPVLVVAPTSVGFNWSSEAARFAPTLACRAYRGPDRAALLDGLGPGDVLITSYDLVSRDAEGLAAVDWGTVVLDEAQAIKNPRTRRSQGVRKLRAGFVLALSGTPVENRVEELWSLFRVLVPGLLGSAESFRETFVRPLQGDRSAAVQARLAGTVRPFLLRRRKDQVALDLPPRTEITVPVVLSPAERALYDRVRRAALQELGDDHPDATWQIRALAALTRLRQLACHPQLVLADSTVPSSKLARVLHLLADLEAEGHRALVFSQFTSHLALVRTALEGRGGVVRYLDGGMTAKRRQREVEAFQDGQGQHFLISLKAGGTGLNLTAATYVLHLDPWWNPAVEDQATDRAHRIGQDQPVTVLRLVAQDTVEDGILALHEQKRALAEALIGGAGRSGTLSAEEVLGLMG